MKYIFREYIIQEIRKILEKRFLILTRKETADNEKQQKQLLDCFNDIVWEEKRSSYGQ